jgi:pSer/pThr/pTyr-binding forkhead associated (FHA) protein
LSKLTLSFKGNVLRVYPVIKGSMLIGNAPDCTIHIDSLALQPHHARIDTQGATSVLVDLDTEGGTFVNNSRISKHMLEDGDVIRIGKHTIHYKFEAIPENPDDSSTTMEIELGETPTMRMAMTSELLAEDPPPSPSVNDKRQGWLQILNGQNLGKTLSLNRPMTNLGKPGVATAVITRRDEGYFLSHLEGEKSPLLDDQPIGDQSVMLQDGNIITIGNVKMQFFLD